MEVHSEKVSGTIEIDGEIVQLRNKNHPTNEEKVKTRRSLRNSIRESFRNNALRRSLVRRTKSYEPQKGETQNLGLCQDQCLVFAERPRIKPKRSTTMKYFLSTVPRSLFNTLVVRM
ncbi:hypothetical protein BDFB_003437 [Asbolus verrucosus]|uniref:Uncharacterized protein n=1 Tax=Asbolus verrucosus TaxID=1661398 RepID=A0A482V1H7_ASBVE|nr:hypothetical protein BDFB_003437 [Asbolus verrucosus]